MARPRAADDFTVIRARMEELRRERAGLPADEVRRPDGPRPYAVSTRWAGPARSGLAPELRRMLHGLPTHDQDRVFDGDRASG